jgi:hypothetical protein
MLVPTLIVMLLILLRMCLPYYIESIINLDRRFNSSPDNRKAIIDTMRAIK